jgi:hypothetical protein
MFKFIKDLDEGRFVALVGMVIIIVVVICATVVDVARSVSGSQPRTEEVKSK